MTRLTMLAVFTAWAFGFQAAATAAAAAATAPAHKQPNILFVLIDDMGYGDLSCFGGRRAKTPNIDRLASEGVRFTQFYVSSPICSPSRVALTTGQYPNRWRITSYLARRDENAKRGIADWLDPKAPTLARTLQQAGYHTSQVGKWHMGGQRDVTDAPAITSYGFDTSITNFEGLGPRILGKFEKLDHGPTAMSAKFAGEADVQWVERHKVTEKFVDRAIAEMDAAAKQDKPFYINLWPDDVHSPMQAPPDQRGDGSPAAQYVGVLSELDRQLGRAFDHIRGSDKLRDNTIILLCSDNGHEPGLGLPGGLRGHKGNLYEGGIRSPLIVWAPKRAPAEGFNRDTVIAAIDIAPSLLALAGVARPAEVKFDGLDMSDVLIGSGFVNRPAPVMWLRPPDRSGPQNSWPDLAIRDGPWKLLVNRDGSRAELYDIPQDPFEKMNLAKQHSDIVKKLATQVIAWDKDTTK